MTLCVRFRTDGEIRVAWPGWGDPSRRGTRGPPALPSVPCMSPHGLPPVPHGDTIVRLRLELKQASSAPKPQPAGQREWGEEPRLAGRWVGEVGRLHQARQASSSRKSQAGGSMEGETTFPAAPRRVSLWSGALTLALPTSALRVRKLQRQEHTAAINLPPPTQGDSGNPGCPPPWKERHLRR